MFFKICLLVDARIRMAVQLITNPDPEVPKAYSSYGFRFEPLVKRVTFR
jgi:hypothetical protein